jgi:hypothetical protein
MGPGGGEGGDIRGRLHNSPAGPGRGSHHDRDGEDGSGGGPAGV